MTKKGVTNLYRDLDMISNLKLVTNLIFQNLNIVELIENV
jgi:hypothetical protein